MNRNSLEHNLKLLTLVDHRLEADIKKIHREIWLRLKGVVA